MRPTAAAALTVFASVALGLPAGLPNVYPEWAVLTLIGVGVLLTAVQVAVTQIIRLRASARITRSQDALRVLEIEDLSRRDRPGGPA